jgi:hypothetical protein
MAMSGMRPRIAKEKAAHRAALRYEHSPVGDQCREPPCEPLPLSPQELPELPRSLPPFLPRFDEPVDELPMFEVSPMLPFEPLSMPLEPTLPLVRLLGSFSELSDRPMFWPKSAELLSLCFCETPRLMSPAGVEVLL